jgi:hypothetical protein
MGCAVKVYGVVASPFVATVLLCLEETGVSYELVPVDMAAREQKTEPYLCRNVSFQSSSTIQMRNYCSPQSDKLSCMPVWDKLLFPVLV